ncbi:unnamed protein product [Calypogeia fissa]
MSAYCERVFGMLAAPRAAVKSFRFYLNCDNSYMFSQEKQDIVEERMAPDPCVEKPAKARFLYSLELDLSLLPPDAA